MVRAPTVRSRTNSSKSTTTNSTANGKSPVDKFLRLRNSPEARQATADLLDEGDFIKRLDDVEMKIEQLGQAQEFVQSFRDYCVALRRDQEALTRIRWVSVIFAFIMIAILLGALVYFTLARGVMFWIMSDVSKATIIVAVVGGAIAILLALLRGSFRTIAERNNDDVVPEHLKTVLEAAKSLSGRG